VRVVSLGVRVTESQPQEYSSSSRANSRSCGQKIARSWGTQNFVPYSQQPAPWPYPQPHESCPRPPKLFIYNRLKYCTLIYAVVFQLVSSFIHPTRFVRNIPSRTADVTLSDGPAQSALVTLRQYKSWTSWQCRSPQPSPTSTLLHPNIPPQHPLLKCPHCTIRVKNRVTNTNKIKILGYAIKMFHKQ
jgi:hypothetical protein